MQFNYLPQITQSSQIRNRKNCNHYPIKLDFDCRFLRGLCGQIVNSFSSQHFSLHTAKSNSLQEIKCIRYITRLHW